MKQLIPYLIFPGKCKEALNFYKECLNGEITLLQTFEESPIDVPSEHQWRIFNSKFEADGLTLMASDDLPSHQVSIGTNIALFVNFSDKQEQHTVFSKLSDSGTVLMPLEGSFGMLEDKFGVRWMIVSE